MSFMMQRSSDPSSLIIMLETKGNVETLCRTLGSNKDWFDHNVIVAFGGDFSYSSLHRELKRRCTTKLISEFRTAGLYQNSAAWLQHGK
ncbi:10572_t:CDS:2 [Entrophospora sp. SA101]|nr:10572_t:CDS:2 [Entrophospora sp. SA101]